MTIPQEAVTAAAKVLYVDKISNHAGDNAPQIIDACERVARKVLEAAAPYLMAHAWDEGAQAGFDVTREGFNGECAYAHCADDDYPPTNPYSGDKWSLHDGSVVEA